jgi:suppressor of fused-like protein
MYANAGNEELNIPPHWHYISFGLSDLHGDGRVHEFVLN